MLICQPSQVPAPFNARVERLYVLHAAHAAGVQAAPAPKKPNAPVQAPGVRLPRSQNLYSNQRAAYRLHASRTGAPGGLATHAPASTPDFLGLTLAEQRRIANASEA